METPLTGEALAIDLVNTRTTGADLIATAEKLGKWLALQQGRVPDGITEVDRETHHAVLTLRDDVSAILRALVCGKEPPSTALRVIERMLDASPQVTRLGWDGSMVTVRTHREGPLCVRLAATLAHAAAALFADSGIAQLRECEAEDCILLFLRTHPRRRWCSSERCGNRTRVARHYRNHRADVTAS